jgi:hypothetical protein
MKQMYVIAKTAYGDIRLDHSGLQVYETRAAAEEDLDRFMFKAGYVVVPLTVVSEPQLLGLPEQRRRWEARKEVK